MGMKILVPTDFSKNAQKGIEFAIQLAKKSGSEIILLHAHEVIKSDSVSRRLLFEEYNLSVARRLNDELKAQKQKIASDNPEVKVSAEFYSNEVKNSIIDATENFGVDLIVMGTQGASGFKNFFMGSVTAKVIGKATVPVLAIPRLYKLSEPQKILLATNKFETHPQILDTILGLVDLCKVHLHLIVFSDNHSADQKQHHEKSLEDYHTFLQKLNMEASITSAHLQGTEFEDTVQQYIDDHAIDMLTMITYKRNFLENIFHRSATKSMSYRTRIPLLAIPALDEQAE
jgi:nucleotide-binding universal stress UspA family protein